MKGDLLVSEAPDDLDEGLRRDQVVVLNLIQEPGRQAEFEVCARLGIPSVAVIAEALSERLPHRRKDRAFKIWIGTEIAKVMRHLGYEIIQPRGRVKWGHFFTYSAVWGKTVDPGAPDPGPGDIESSVTRRPN